MEPVGGSGCDLVVVSYNSAHHLRETWRTKKWDDDTSVYVVDNSSTDDSLDIAREFATGVATSANRGLSVGNNIGASMGSAPYVVFCNPDLDIEQHHVDALVAHLERESCLVTGRLLNPDGSAQPNARRFPTVRRQLASKGLGRAEHRTEYLWGELHGVVRTDWFLGACLAVRRSDLVRLGGWPNQYFLYFEDVALCREAWRQDLPVYVDNDIRIPHGWARSSGRLSRSTAWHARSAVTFYVENPNLIWPQTQAVLATTLAGQGERRKVLRSVSQAFRRT